MMESQTFIEMGWDTPACPATAMGQPFLVQHHARSMQVFLLISKI